MWKTLNDAENEGLWYEWNPELKNLKGKLKWPFHLAIISIFCEDSEEERPATTEEQAKIVAFHEGLPAQLGVNQDVLLVGRTWHKAFTQLELRVHDPEFTNGKLQDLIAANNHPYPFQYQMMPDGAWKGAKVYWNRDIPVSDTETPAEDSDEEDTLETLQTKLATAQGTQRIPLWFKLAKILAEDASQWDAAADLLQSGLNEYPDEGKLLGMLSVVRIRQRKLDEARTILHRALELDDLRSMLHYNLACAEALAQRPEEALSALKNALLISPLRAFDAASDTDLAILRDREDFKKLTDMSRFGLKIGSREQVNPHPHTLLVVMPARIDPIERGEKFQDPLAEFLKVREAGTVLGGNTQLALSEGGSASTTLEIGSSDMETTLAAVREFFQTVPAPEGTKLYPHTTVQDPLDPAQGLTL